MTNAEKLPKTDITATLEFQTRDATNSFAKAYTRKSLMGHIITGNTVIIYNVTDEIKTWINDYINN